MTSISLKPYPSPPEEVKKPSFFSAPFSYIKRQVKDYPKTSLAIFSAALGALWMATSSSFSNPFASKTVQLRDLNHPDSKLYKEYATGLAAIKQGHLNQSTTFFDQQLPQMSPEVLKRVQMHTAKYGTPEVLQNLVEKQPYSATHADMGLYLKYATPQNKDSLTQSQAFESFNQTILQPDVSWLSSSSSTLITRQKYFQSLLESGDHKPVLDFMKLCNKKSCSLQNQFNDFEIFIDSLLASKNLLLIEQLMPVASFFTKDHVLTILHKLIEINPQSPLITQFQHLPQYREITTKQRLVFTKTYQLRLSEYNKRDFVSAFEQVAISAALVGGILLPIENYYNNKHTVKEMDSDFCLSWFQKVRPFLTLPIQYLAAKVEKALTPYDTPIDF